MTLTLTIAHLDRLDNGSPVAFVLDRRSAVIGRSPACDWTLPDPRQFISSRHCEVAFRDGAYTLTDVSTNGTLLNGATHRMSGPRRIEAGDRFQVGQYDIVATLADRPPAPSAGSDWGGFASPPAPPPSVATRDWGSTPAAGSSWDLPAREKPASPGWNPPATAPASAWPAASPPDHGLGGWEASPQAASIPDWASPPAGSAAAATPWPSAVDPAPAAPPPPPAAATPSPSRGGDDWLSAAPVGAAPWPAIQGEEAWPAAIPEPPATPPADDVWGKITEGNAVDWTRGGFGATDGDAGFGAQSPPPPAAWAPAAAGMDAPRVAASAPWPAADPGAAALPIADDGRQTVPPGPMPTAAADPAPVVDAFAAAAGLKPGQLHGRGVETIERAGALLRQLVAGLVVMVEARARAKSQMGAEATSLNFQGNNPIKFARAPEQALAQLLNPKERGFMDADVAIEDAFHDLQSHQIATLKAMQGALRATLDRFSPAAIKARAESKGLMGRIMPGAREAALWQAYEREFSGVAQGSDEAFMDVFANEFRKAYEDQATARR